MKISTFFKEAATDVAAVVGGGAALVGVGIGAAAAIGGVPLIAAGAAIGGTVAGPTILIGRVASHIIDGIQSKVDTEYKHNGIARTLKVLSFGVGLAAGAGLAAGIACIPALGLTVATAAAVIGAVALAATVGYVAYLALRGTCNLIAYARQPAQPPQQDQLPEEVEAPVAEEVEAPANNGNVSQFANNEERRNYIADQIPPNYDFGDVYFHYPDKHTKEEADEYRLAWAPTWVRQRVDYYLPRFNQEEKQKVVDFVLELHGQNSCNKGSIFYQNDMVEVSPQTFKLYLNFKHFNG